MNRSRHFAIGILGFICAGLAAAGGPQTIVVIGQDDVNVDRAAIQAGIDSAEERDTVELQGTFQLDGTSIFVQTSRLSIVGQAIDNDGDGSVNEDPVDGIDNDSDGQTDEDDWDARLKGVDDGAGGPAGDAFPNRFNDGFELLGFDGELRNMAFRDLELSKLNRAIYLFPDYDDGGTVFLCDSATATSGTLENIEVSGNSFENGIRGVELAGRVTKLTIEDNSFSDIGSQAIVLFGQELFCAEADGSLVQILPFGTPERTRVSDNQLTGVNAGVLSFISSRTSIRNNTISDATFGVASLEDSRLSAFHNTIEFAIAAGFGSFLDDMAGPALKNAFSENTLSNNFWGVIVDCDTTGYRISENEYTGSFISDVLLDGTSPGGECAGAGLGDSFENTVIANTFPTFVEDFGVDNRLLGSMILTAPAGGTLQAAGGLRRLLLQHSRP